MKEKIAIAHQLRVSRKDFNDTLEDKKLCSKCYRTYVIECIIKGNEDFQISFEGEYIQGFPERISDWYSYILDSIYRFFLINFTPNDDKTFKKYELIHYGVKKPIHLKLTAKTPNEKTLYNFLEKNGFKITEEHLYSESTVYDVSRA